MSIVGAPAQLSVYDLRGAPGTQGLSHGRALRSMLAATIEPYLAALEPVHRITDRAELERRALRWMENLPAHVREEIDGMARGAAQPVATLAAFLYADIAAGSPACTGIVAPSGEGAVVGRNCDWLAPTLIRGVSMVVHRVEGRLATFGIGINGDIDVDTGANEAGLWLHVHTMHATDAVDAGRQSLSWLFWAREALEQCATLDDLERFCGEVQRDRGMILITLHGPTDEGAIYECGRSSWRCAARGRGEFLMATNHAQSRHPTCPVRLSRSPARGTTRRLERVRALMDGRAEGTIEETARTLADGEVEMTPTGKPGGLETIYTAIARPSRGDLWFSAPGGSRGCWRRIDWPF